MAHIFSNRPSLANISEDMFDFGHGVAVSQEISSHLAKLTGQIFEKREDAGPLWGMFDTQCMEEYRTLSRNNLSDTNGLISRLFGSNITRGFLQGPEVHNDLKARVESRLFVGGLILDRFYRLAEAVGAARVLSAEHGQTSITIGDLNDIMARIEDEVGADLPAPQQDGGMFGLRLRGGLYTERHFDGLYAAWRARQLARAKGRDHQSICEIGGGAGHLTFYARQLGFRSCAIIDLPQAMIAQYIVLSSAFGQHRVSVDHPVRDGVELIPAGSPEADSTHRYDIVINVDSLPEMSVAVAERYVSNIARGQTFVSINQESAVPNGEHGQNVVCEIASRAQVRRESRYPAWLRTGYVEEIFSRPT